MAVPELRSIQPEISWLKAHERIVIAVLVTIILLWLGNKWINREDQIATLKVQQAQQTLAQQVKINDDLKQTVAQQQANTDRLAQLVQAQNASLQQAIASRTVVVQKQQEAEKTMPLPDVAVRWEQLLNLPASDIQNVSGTLQVSDAASRTTVEQLETVPVLQKNLADTQTMAANKDREIASLTSLNGDLKQQTAGLSAQLTDQDKVCKTEIAKVKADARKSKIRWFLSGAVAGFIGRVLTAR